VSPPHNQPDLGQLLIRSLNEHGAGLTLVTPEPEVVRAQLSSIRCKTLADTIAHLLTEHEPMLRAKADGDTVSVRVLGDPEVMRFKITGENE
jgi:hypothetical protein